MISTQAVSHTRTKLKVIGRPTRNQYLCIPIPDGKRIIHYTEILYLKSDSNYTEIYLTDNKKYCVCRTIKSLEDQIPTSDFIRVHRSYLVSIKHIKYIYNSDSTIELRSGNKVPFSRSGKNKLSLLYV